MRRRQEAEVTGRISEIQMNVCKSVFFFFLSSRCLTWCSCGPQAADISCLGKFACLGRSAETVRLIRASTTNSCRRGGGCARLLSGVQLWLTPDFGAQVCCSVPNCPPRLLRTFVWLSPLWRKAQDWEIGAGQT